MVMEEVPYVRKEWIGNIVATIYRPLKLTEKAKKKIEKELLEKGYVYIGYTSISADPCSYRYETEILEAQDIAVIDMTYFDGPDVYTEKYYYVKPPARAVFRDYHIECGPNGYAWAEEYLITVDETGRIEKKRIK